MVFVQASEGLRWVAVIAFCVAAVIVVRRLGAVGDRESDAAHLLMCLVMLAMLVFPAAADPRAVRGVLTAMTVVYALVLGGRILQWRSDIRQPGAGGSVMAFAYHVAAAAAMLYAMGGHRMAGMAMPGGPAVGPALTLAVLFAVDALVMTVPWSRHAVRHLLPHPVGAMAVLPHVVMDLGTAYMLVIAVAG